MHYLHENEICNYKSEFNKTIKPFLTSYHVSTSLLFKFTPTTTLYFPVTYNLVNTLLHLEAKVYNLTGRMYINIYSLYKDSYFKFNNLVSFLMK